MILAFALNFRTAEGLNTDLAQANLFNERVFSLCSMIEPRADFGGIDLMLTSSRFDPAVYGHRFVNAFCARMGVRPASDQGVDFLISTTMGPRKRTGETSSPSLSRRCGAQPTRPSTSLGCEPRPGYRALMMAVGVKVPSSCGRPAMWLYVP